MQIKKLYLNQETNHKFVKQIGVLHKNRWEPAMNSKNPNTDKHPNLKQF